MRGFNLFGLWVIGSQARHKAIFEVYGDLPEVESMKPRTRVPRTRSSLGRTPENCSFPLEVIIFQDLTSSFDDDIDQMITVQLDKLFDTIESSHPGSSYGLVSFKDKPIYPLGIPEAGDYCQRFDLVPVVHDISQIKDAYKKMHVNGGGDAPENQFGAIYSALKSGFLNTGSTATKLLVLSTDAPPHFENDGYNELDLPPFTGKWNYADQDEICVAEYYPPPEVVRDIILEQNFYGTFLVFDDGWWDSLPLRSWEWFNSFLGQTNHFVGNLASDASNFWVLLQKVITEVENLECQSIDTTSMAPTEAEPTSKSTRSRPYQPPVATSSTSSTRSRPYQPPVTTSSTTTTSRPTTRSRNSRPLQVTPPRSTTRQQTVEV